MSTQEPIDPMEQARAAYRASVNLPPDADLSQFYGVEFIITHKAGPMERNTPVYHASMAVPKSDFDTDVKLIAMQGVRAFLTLVAQIPTNGWKGQPATFPNPDVEASEGEDRDEQ